MKNIHVLEINQPSRLWFDYLGHKLVLSEISDTVNARHIYITSSEELKKGDWYLFNNQVFLAGISTWEIKDRETSNCKKIILTTDTTLIEDGVQAIDDTFLEWFVKNPTCEFVKTELLDVSEVLWEEYFKKHGVYPKYPWYEKIIIPQEEPKTNLEKLPFPKLVEEFANYYKKVPLVEESKQETLEEAAENWLFESDEHDNQISFIKGAKWQAERMHSEEEMIAFCEWVSETIPTQSNYLRNLRRFNRGENIPPEKLRGYYTTKQLLEKFKNKEL
jgi:hypothetical protein